MRPVPSPVEPGSQSALQFAAKQLQQLAVDAADRQARDGVDPGYRPEVRPELQRALDATWERSEAVYRALSDE